MLRAELIDLINDGTAWAFVGSGTSIDAGYPSWPQLVDGALVATPSGIQEKIRGDHRFVQAFRDQRYESCLSVVENFTDRSHLERVITAQLADPRDASELVTQIGDWPFAGYVTSNYDTLLEQILQTTSDAGWIPVGNSDSEIRKVSGDARNLIWHVHGGGGLDRDRSKLILTEEDYDDLYLEESPLTRQLRALLTQKRFVFIGFSFRDPELRRLLKIVRKYTSPTHPIFAFIGSVPSRDDDASRLDLLERYNVDVIPYPVVNGSHAALGDLADIYGSLVLRRSLRFGQPQRECPSYDPETTGLLVYNRLALGSGFSVTQDTLGALVRARVLSLLKHRGPSMIAELTEDLIERIHLMAEVTQPSDSLRSQSNTGADTISKAIAELERLNLVEEIDGGLGPAAQLTPDGKRLTDDQAASASRMSEQFSVGLQARARTAAKSDDTESHRRIGTAAETFLKECATRRALGVAMAWYSPSVDFQAFHIVALLQELPRYAEQLRDMHEGRGLIEVIRSVLSSPSEIESIYLGSLMQAQFGLHLMGFDPDVIAARTRELSTTLFLLDSTTLIPLLARSSTAHQAALHLLSQIAQVGATPATTDLLSIEVAEHARWALKALGESATITTIEALAAATGHAGARDNEFINGCVAEAAEGRTLDFHQYLDSICGSSQGHTGSDEAFQTASEGRGIACLAFSDWEGFDKALWSDRDKVQEQIAERRRLSGTYHHERQVQAEAESLLAVQSLREGSFGLGGRHFTDAYFLSHSRVIDDVAKPTRPITIRPQAAQQWLSTLTACSADELKYIVNGLLSELSERGMSIVDTTRILTVFSPLIDASKRQLQEELAHHRNLISERYGEKAVKAFGEVAGLDAPFVAEGHFARKSDELESLLDRERQIRTRAEKAAALTEKEREELRTLRALKKTKQMETRRKRRKLVGRQKKRAKKRR